MGVARTNWHVDRLPTLDMEDAFEADVEQVGKPIDLSGPTAGLDVRLRELLDREGRLDALGVTCSYKEHRDVSCNVCPVSQVGQGTPLGELCAVGREQEQVVTAITVRRWNGSAS